MKVTEAIDRVGALYVPGVVAYYGRLTPDPWQKAHDDLERLAGVVDENELTAPLEQFIARCSELIERFKREGSPSKIQAPEAFLMASARQVQAHMSRKHKRCARCDSKENLRIVPASPGSMDVMLLCLGCQAKGNSA
jgi:hypothetical protein